MQVESPDSIVGIEQSQPNRTKGPFQLMELSLQDAQAGVMHRLPRLHFDSTTANNMRKKGKPNPDQRYFTLGVTLMAITTTGQQVSVQQVRCQRIIVRASNPGQYSNEIDQQWSKGRTHGSVVHYGQVGINVEDPKEALAVGGNIRYEVVVIDLVVSYFLLLLLIYIYIYI